MSHSLVREDNSDTINKIDFKAHFTSSFRPLCRGSGCNFGTMDERQLVLKTSGTFFMSLSAECQNIKIK